MDTRSATVSPSDQGQKEAFLNELSQFLSDKGRLLCRAPNLAGRIIDLHDLYNKVTSAGGYQKATERGYWEDFLDVYGYPAVSTSLGYGLQKIYQLYLEDYERVHYFGDDEPLPYYRSFPGGYRKYRYKISDLQRTQANMNMLKPSVSDYDRVVLSLESCLPNEIDFAVNACTLLSGESRHVLRLPQCRRIVDALLMHAGIVSDGQDNYRGVLGELQNKTKHNYRKFWNNSVANKAALPILLPANKKQIDPKEPDSTKSNGESRAILVEDMEVEQSSDESDFTNALQKRLQDIQGEDEEGGTLDIDDQLVKKSRWSELFHGHRSLGVEDYEGQRVLQIALVLLNLSFEDFNVTLLARHPSLIRFVFLCIHSEYSCLRQTGLDILSNISSHMQLLHLQYDIMTMIFDTINTAVLSHDKFERIRGFEILGNVCRRRPNVDHVCAYVCDEVYDAAVQNLMINDVEILLAAIEALYRLSKLGELTCTKIIFIKGCIDILMCLVTLNVRTFGSEKLAEIRLARKILPGQPDHHHQQQQQALPSYHLPAAPQTIPHPSHAAMMQRQMQLQQQAKLGSAHQAQPTYAPAIVPPPASVPATAQTRPPLPQQPQMSIKTQPKVEPTLTPASTSAQFPVQQVPPAAQVQNTTQQQTPSQNVPQVPPQTISSPPPPSSTPPSQPLVPKTSPPGVGPTYTHSETGTIPPVFHYMPAPPNDIVQDSSAESFTKLWIWATYESQSESYIPRVDVYCEYLASSNRYGRQGKTEILSATDFGRCLKQIFPQATSRLFNQGRGQPQYHIAGIKKRATPLPVPGHQLKDSHSVFSSDSDQVAVTRPPAPATVTSKSRPSTSTTPRPALPSPPPAAQLTSTTALPIQQLQFQPILIVSTVPGTNNVALVPGAQLTAAPPQVNQTPIMAVGHQAAIAFQQPLSQNVATVISVAQPMAQNQHVTAASSQIVSGIGVVPAAQTIAQTHPATVVGVVQQPQAQIANATTVIPAAHTVAETIQAPVVEDVQLPQTQASNALPPAQATTEVQPQPTTGSGNSISHADSQEPHVSTADITVTPSAETPAQNLPVAVKVPDETVPAENTQQTPAVTSDMEMTVEAAVARTVSPQDQAVPPVTNNPESEPDKNAEEVAVPSVMPVVSRDIMQSSQSVTPADATERVQPPAEEECSATSNIISEKSSNPSTNCAASSNVATKTVVDQEKGLKDANKSPSLLKDGVETAIQEQSSLGNGPEKCETQPKTDCNHSNAVTNGYMKVDASSKKSTIPEKPAKEKRRKSKDIDKTLQEQAKKTRKRRRTKSKDAKQMVNGIGEDVVKPTEEQNPIKNNGINGPSSIENVTESKDIINGETETEAAVNSILDPSDTSVDEIMKMDVSDIIKTPPPNTQSETLKPENTEIQTDAVCSSNPIPDKPQTEPIQMDAAVASSSSHGTAQLPQDSVVTATVHTDSVTPNVSIATHEPTQNVAPCVTMTPTTQTMAQVPVTPTNPIPHSTLNQRLKDTITRRKNSQLNSNSTLTNSLPPSVIHQYSYKQDGLAQHIIPITPQQLQQQYHQQRQVPTTNNHQEQTYQGTPQAGNKRPSIQTPGPPAKVARPTQQPLTYTPNPQQYHPRHHSLTPRHPTPGVPYRPPHPQVTQQHQMPPRPNTPMGSSNPHHSGAQPKPKAPTIDLMAPNASLLVLYRNVGKIPFANHMDEKEDAISKSVRLTASLILTNIARYSNLGRSLLQKHEDSLARVAMSQMDCSPIVARLLSELDV